MTFDDKRCHSDGERCLVEPCLQLTKFANMASTIGVCVPYFHNSYATVSVEIPYVLKDLWAIRPPISCYIWGAFFSQIWWVDDVAIIFTQICSARKGAQCRCSTVSLRHISSSTSMIDIHS